MIEKGHERATGREREAGIHHLIGLAVQSVGEETKAYFPSYPVQRNVGQ